VSSANVGDLSSECIAAPLDYALKRVRKTILQRTSYEELLNYSKASVRCLI
jgi:hypothetical protein